MRVAFYFVGMLLIAVSAGGCSWFSTPVPIEDQIGSLPMQSISTMVTTLPPTAVAEKMHDIFTSLRLSIQTGELRNFGIRDGGASDYFTARAAALGADENRYLVVAKWKQEGETLVTFSSDLQSAEHEHVRDLIRAAINGTNTTQPTTR